MRNWTALSGGVTVLAVVLLAGVGKTSAAGRGAQVNGAGMQQTLPGQAPERPDSALPVTDPTSPYAGKMESAQARTLREERHKKLLEDTARLVQLSNELKVEVDKAGKDDLSLTVIKKASDIEKLAHDVKERMKN